MGRTIIVAGVAWQVFSLMLFATLCGDYALRVRKASSIEFNADFEQLRASRPFKAFLYGLGIATLATFVRSVFRCAEFSEGFDGKLANQQITFMILESAMISIAVICLTAFHPGMVLKTAWHSVDWSMKRHRKSPADHEKSGEVDLPLMKTTQVEERVHEL